MINNWWETPGLRPSEMGGYSIPSSAPGSWSQPASFYDWYWSTPESERSALMRNPIGRVAPGSPFEIGKVAPYGTPGAGGKYLTPEAETRLGIGQTVGEPSAELAPEPVDISGYEAPPHLEDWRLDLGGLFREQMSPDFTLFSAEDRAAADRAIGARQAVTNREIAEEMRRRGTPGSGIEQQMLRHSALTGGREAADLRAQLNWMDQQHRDWAAMQLESMRRFGATGEGGLLGTIAGLPVAQALAAAPTVLAGPGVETPDMAAFLQTQEGRNLLREQLEMLAQEGNWGPQDWAEVGLAFLGAGVNLTDIFGG